MKMFVYLNRKINESAAKYHATDHYLKTDLRMK